METYQEYCHRLAKIVNMQGEDITPPPLSLEDNFIEDLMLWIQTMPLEQFREKLFQKYSVNIKN